MFLEYSTIMIMTGVCCAALVLVTLVAWLANKRQHFLLTWSLSTLVLLTAALAFGYFAETPTPFGGWAASAASVLGVTGAWVASVQFENRSSPWLGALLRLAVALAVLTILALAGLYGLMLVAMNAITAAILLESAGIYYSTRKESYFYVLALASLYAIAATSFAACAISLLFYYPLDFLGVPNSLVETINGVTSILVLTGIGALSLALIHERVALRHRADAMTDALTGFLNRRALLELGEANGAIDNAAAIVFDLDNFKQINDTYGHAIGDIVLRRFTILCRQGLRATDLAARIGGEEFAVILPGAQAEAAHAVAERIRERFEKDEVTTRKGRIRHCTVSAGVFATPPGKSVEVEELIRRADAALYQAKRNGRNQVCTQTHEPPAA